MEIKRCKDCVYYIPNDKGTHICHYDDYMNCIYDNPDAWIVGEDLGDK